MNILVTAPMREQDLAQLRTMFDTVTYKPWTENGTGWDAQTTLSLLQESKADAFISELDDVSKEVLDAYHGLKFIGDCRAVPANIDIETATKYGIPVLCTPGRNAQAVAELLVGMLVCFMRNVQPSIRWIEEGKWVPGTTPYYEFMGNEICGKKIGFVGFGAVGRATAKILNAFGAEIAYYDPYVFETPEGYQKCELEPLMAESDIVSIHLPVLPSTKGMIGAELLGKMRSDAVLVNTSRSAVMDMQALAQVLKEKKIRGAVLDVYDHEPPQDTDLEIMAMDNVLATPHICGATYEVTDHQSRIILANIQKWFAGEDLPRIVFNKGVL